MLDAIATGFFHFGPFKEIQTVTRQVYLFVLSRVGFEPEYMEAPCRFAWFPCRSILLSNA